MTKLKAAKLLFLLDKWHLVRFGRPVTGDRYVHMDRGPVPSVALNLLNDLITPDESSRCIDPRLELQDILCVDKEAGPYPVFRALRKPDLTVLSETDVEALEKVSDLYDQKSAGELIELTHTHPTWARSPRNGPIDFELFFEEDSDADADALRYMIESQGDRDLAEALNV